MKNTLLFCLLLIALTARPAGNTYTGAFIGNGAGLSNVVATLPNAVTNSQQNVNIGGTFKIQSSGNQLVGSAGQSLIDGNGNATLASVTATNITSASGGVFTGDGSGITNLTLPAAQLTGTLPLSVIPSQVPTNTMYWAFDGHSWVDGGWTSTSGIGRSNSWANLLISNTPVKYMSLLFTNMAKLGRFASTFTSDYTNYLRPILTNYNGPKTYFLMGCINDFLNNATSNQVYGYFTNCIALAHADGAKVVVGIEPLGISDPFASGQQSSNWVTWVSMMRSITNLPPKLSPDVLVDVVANYTDLTTVDGTHPDDIANQAIANLYYAALFREPYYASENGNYNLSRIRPLRIDGTMSIPSITANSTTLGGMTIGSGGSSLAITGGRIVTLVSPGNGWDWANGTAYNMQLDSTSGNLSVLGTITGNGVGLTNFNGTGIAQLSSGSNQVSTALAKLSSRILLTYISKDGTVASLYYKTNEIISGSSFTIRSSNSTDTNNVNWFIVP